MTSRRVLSVQSHVVHGYVGNKCAIFPLQLLGFDVDSINTVQFCNHTGYPKFAGQVLDGSSMKALTEGLEENGLFKYSHLLTGYIGSKSVLEQVVDLIQRLRESDDSIVYFCDPVLGDNGKLYVPSMQDLVDVYRDQIIPMCTVLTPNQFEAEMLTDIKITDLRSALEACEKIHKQGVETVVLTTLELDKEKINMLLSTRRKAQGSGKWLLTLPKLGTEASFTGTGDLTSALLLAWINEHPDELPLALEKTGATMQKVIDETIRGGPVRSYPNGKKVCPELRVIQSKMAIESPLIIIRTREVFMHQEKEEEKNSAATLTLGPETKRWEGVVFDMDATLTEPGQINFEEMRRRVSVPEGDIITMIRRMPSSEDQERCLKIVHDMEMEAFHELKLMPHCQQAITNLKQKGLKVGLLTRNMNKCVEIFEEKAGLKGLFDAIVTRETPVTNKPSPDGLLHISEQWGIPPEKLLMVGDHNDDLFCGRAAGSSTCLIGTVSDAATLDAADYIITDLRSLERFI